MMEKLSLKKQASIFFLMIKEDLHSFQFLASKIKHYTYNKWCYLKKLYITNEDNVTYTSQVVWK